MTDSPYGGQSTTDTAKEQAGQVGQTAKESGQKVAGTAAEQAKNVFTEGKDQVRNLHGEVRQQVTEQSTAQKDRAVTGLRSLADELKGMADSGQQSQSGIAADLAQQASAKAHELATWLDDRDPSSLLEEVRSIARRKPGTFLLGAVAAGVLAGRMTRGAVDAAKSDSSDTSGNATSTSNATAPVASTYDAPVVPSTTADAFPGTTEYGTAAHEGEAVNPAITLPGDTGATRSNDYSGNDYSGNDYSGSGVGDYR